MIQTDCKAKFDGHEVFSCEVLLEPGIMPGGGYAELTPGAWNTIKPKVTLDEHILELQTGDTSIRFENLHITSVEQETVVSPVKISFKDRRWKWERYNVIMKSFNILQEDSDIPSFVGYLALPMIEPFSSKDGKGARWFLPEIVEELLKAMDEKPPPSLRTFIPRIFFPNIKGEGQNPAKVMLELLERVSLQIKLNLKGEIEFFKPPATATPNLPSESLISSENTEENVELPDEIWIIGNRILDQTTLPLEPVFIESETRPGQLPPSGIREAGEIKSLFDPEGLKYFGWKTLEEAYQSAPDFVEIEDKYKRSVAKKYLFKWWRITAKTFSEGSLSVNKTIQDNLSKFLPYLKTLNSKIKTPEGGLVRAPLRVFGPSFEVALSATELEGKEKEAGHGYYENISNLEIKIKAGKFRSQGIIETSRPIRPIDQKQTADLTVPVPFLKFPPIFLPEQPFLQFAYERKGSENWEDDWYVYKFVSPTAVPASAEKKKILYIKMKELFQIRIDGKEQNKETLDKICLDFAREFYKGLANIRRGGRARLAGIFPYEPGVSFSSVRFSASSSGLFTEVSYGSNKSAFELLDTYQEKVRRSLADYGMLIEGSELSRYPGDDASMGTGTFKGGDEGADIEPPEKLLEFHNAHHTGPIALASIPPIPLVSETLGVKIINQYGHERFLRDLSIALPPDYESVAFCANDFPAFDKKHHRHTLKQFGCFPIDPVGFSEKPLVFDWPRSTASGEEQYPGQEGWGTFFANMNFYQSHVAKTYKGLARLVFLKFDEAGQKKTGYDGFWAFEFDSPWYPPTLLSVGEVWELAIWKPLNMHQRHIIEVPLPEDRQDAANREYVDQEIDKLDGELSAEIAEIPPKIKTQIAGATAYLEWLLWAYAQ